MTYDAVVVGLGGMGSAVLAHCAARGLQVLGVERFGPVHSRGASHGRSRIIRQATFEGASYVPLLQRAYVLWDDLERRSGATLRARTGALFAGAPDTAVVAGTLASARTHALDVAVLEPHELRRFYPQVRMRPGEVAVFESSAGVLFPERCVKAYLAAAVDDGAEARFGVRALAWDVAGGDAVVVDLGAERVHARRAVFCAGAWLSALAPHAGLPLAIERNVQLWFAPRSPDDVRPERLPVFALERPELPFMFYGFPDFGDGVKCAFHHSGTFVDPDALERTATLPEVAGAAAALRDFLPAAAGLLRASVACTYALTPDEHFIIGAHPGVSEVVLAGGFSGHGFKFCSVVGELVAALVAGETPRYDLAAFAPQRFAGAAA